MIWNLSSHHFVAKHQSEHLKSLKTNLKPAELIILMDVAENYSFIVQDASQGFHWENSQATVHPFAVYNKRGDDGEIQCTSMCVISDCLAHDTVAVHTFLSKVICLLKEKFGPVRYIYYFSDGAAAQYKNYKNFLNPCSHDDDFGVKAECNFFATSHGKSPCDGIGGTVKRLAARSSLQHPTTGQILTPDDLYSFCRDNITGITSIFVSKEEIKSVHEAQISRFACGSTVAGTRENHHFIPVDKNHIQVSRVSGDITSFIATFGSAEAPHVQVQLSDLEPGRYVACMYDEKWWIGNVCENSEEEKDSMISFMHPNGPSNQFCWPSRRDTCWIPWDHILCVIVAPSTTGMGWKYTLLKKTLAEIETKFKQLITWLGNHKKPTCSGF